MSGMPVRIVVPLFRTLVPSPVAVVVLSGAMSPILHLLVGGVQSLVTGALFALLVVPVVLVHSIPENAGSQTSS